MAELRFESRSDPVRHSNQHSILDFHLVSYQNALRTHKTIPLKKIKPFIVINSRENIYFCKSVISQFCIHYIYIPRLNNIQK